MRLNKIAVFLILGVLSISATYGQSRVVRSFNDNWQYYKAHNSTFFTEFENGQKYVESQGQWTRLEVWENVQLPHTHNKDDMQTDRNFFEGKAVYKKKFTLNPSDKEKRTFVKFEGVGSVAQVYINDSYIGEHRGGYSMFAFEITHSVDYEKENTITVVTDNKARRDVLPINQFLFPIYGGIYRPVHIITTSKTNFVVTDRASAGIYIRQKNVSSKQADIQVEAKLETKEKTVQKADLVTEIRGYDGKLVSSDTKAVQISPQGVTYTIQTLRLKNPHLWDGVRDPYLYSVTAKLMVNGKELDVVKQPLGVRTIEIVAGKGVFLNGQKYPMYGVARHQDRQGVGSALSFEQHKEDFLLMKEMGVTTIRLAHYQQSPEVYALADTLGFLTWAEIPFVNRVSYYEHDNARQQMTELVKQNFNHPSIYIGGCIMRYIPKRQMSRFPFFPGN